MSLPHFEFTVSRANLLQDAAKVCILLHPEWQESDIQSKEMTDGITNSIVRCIHGVSSSTVLIRVFGVNTEQIIDRQKELESFTLLRTHGLAPPVFGTFLNGFACGYFPGAAIGPEHVIDPRIFPKIASRLALFHKVPVVDADKKCSVFDDIFGFLQKIPHAFSDPLKDKRFRELIDLQWIGNETSALKKVLDTDGPQDLVLCHNDLLCKNIIFDEEGEGSVYFIDFEYSRCNHRAYDIGNHFNEHAGVSDIDFARYPAREFQWHFLRYYLATLHGVSTESVTEQQITVLHALANKYALASHLLWGTWAVFQAENSTIDFDFLGYAKLRLDEYSRRKEAFLAL